MVWKRALSRNGLSCGRMQYVREGKKHVQQRDKHGKGRGIKSIQINEDQQKKNTGNLLVFLDVLTWYFVTYIFHLYPKNCNINTVLGRHLSFTIYRKKLS